MARKGKEKQQGRPRRGGSSNPRQQGLHNFQSGHFDSAIAVWKNLAPNDAEVASALAEAHFRRALVNSNPSEQVASLQQALKWNPSDLRYRYHLGLAWHRHGEISTAIECYHAVLQHEPGWHGAGMVLAVAELERNPHIDLATLPGTTPTIRETLTPVQALLQGKVPARKEAENTGGVLETLRRSLGLEKHDDTMSNFWLGLGLLQAGEAAASADLLSTSSLPHKEMKAVQHYYKGVADARLGNMDAAIEAWQHSLQHHDIEPGWLLRNLALALGNDIDKTLAEGDIVRAEELAMLLPSSSTGNAALDYMIVRALDHIAHALAERAMWDGSVELWQHAREVVSSSSNLGTPRPILHNLALAYEALEDWNQAAETWRAMLRTQPRPKKTDKASSKTKGKAKQYEPAEQPDPAEESVASTGIPDAAQWAWVRKRVIECYRQAGRPDEAVTIFRQAIKKDPHDLDLRMQFTAALIANDQEQAAQNELLRILDRDPHHIDALMRLAALYSQWGRWLQSQQTLQQVIDLDPQREDVRREVARLILARGQHEHRMGFYDSAARTYREGQKFNPQSYLFPLQLARVSIDQGKMKDVPPLLDQVLELGADDTDAYILVIECWTVVGNREKVREILAHAEATITPTVDFYIGVGDVVLRHIARPTQSPPLLGLLSAEKPRPRKTKEEAPGWMALANELLDRAVALQPGDHRLLFRIAADIMTIAPELALTYAEQGLELAPEEPYALITYGLIQAMNDDTQGAKKTLSRAIRFARKQGDMEMARHAEELRQQINDPFFRVAMSMGNVLGDLEGDIDPFL